MRSVAHGAARRAVRQCSKLQGAGSGADTSRMGAELLRTEAPADAEVEGLERLLQACRWRRGAFEASFKGFRLGTALQPVWSCVHQRPVGAEALVRAIDESGAIVPPRLLFSATRRARELRVLDRLCRVVHMANFEAARRSGWLFLNVSPGLAVPHDGPSFLDRAIDHFGLPREQVVVDLSAGSGADETRLEESAAFYRSFGCLVALDDFGAAHGRLDQLWRVAPHIVKLDRRLIADARDRRVVRRSLPGIVALLHEAGALVLAQGVEREEEALIALDADVDLMQGYLFGRPSSGLDPLETEASLCRKLHDRHRVEREEAARDRLRRLSPDRDVFESVCREVAAGLAWKAAADRLLAVPRAAACFTVDDRGLQTEPTRYASDAGAATPVLAPLADASGANWQQRAWFHAALGAPDVVQVSVPARVTPTDFPCSLLACAVRRADETRVLCWVLREPTLA